MEPYPPYRVREIEATRLEGVRLTGIAITLVGGPTALIEFDGLRMLTDPTFDQPGLYRHPHATLEKTAGPAIAMDQIGKVDLVLLSHDQHSDNLDRAGRELIRDRNRAARVLTTRAGAQRLGSFAIGLAPWEVVRVTEPDRPVLEVTAVPARHGPAGIEPLSGDVIGFMLTAGNGPTRSIYVTGDTVWFDGVAEVSRRFDAAVVILFAGAARTRGPINLTMNVNDAIETARAFPDAAIVPIHCEGWAHLTQGSADLKAAFDTVGLASRLRLIEPGQRLELAV